MRNKLILTGALLTVLVGMTSCKKCAECHYDKNGQEFELGEYCDDAMEDLETNGYHHHEDDTTYQAFCGAH
jgi:hypothetical protein